MKIPKRDLTEVTLVSENADDRADTEKMKKTKMMKMKMKMTYD